MRDLQNQRWLILSHSFNMDGRAASQTITDKIPHLLAAGIEIVVLSGVSGNKDKKIEHHQLWPIAPSGILFELRHVLRRKNINPFFYRLAYFITLLALSPFYLVEKLFYPIENSWSWWISAYLKGLALSRHKHFDLIYSTGGASCAHEAGHALKGLLGIPWIAEVHDPLVVPGNTPSSAQEKYLARIETLICQDADIPIWFTNQAVASARARHPQLGDKGKALIPGADYPFQEWPRYQAGPKFIIGYFGSLSASRNLVQVIKALELTKQRNPETIAFIELHVSGGPIDKISAVKIASSSVANCVHYLGRIEEDPVLALSGRDQILRRMRFVDVLLLLHGKDRICEEYIPSKLYEYLWMQRPILAIVHNNSQMSSILLRSGNLVVESNEVEEEFVIEEISIAIKSLFDRFRDSDLHDNGFSSPFTSKSAVEQLLEWAAELSTDRSTDKR